MQIRWEYLIPYKLDRNTWYINVSEQMVIEKQKKCNLKNANKKSELKNDCNRTLKM